MNPYSVLLKPLLSEKSDSKREAHNQYSFVIATEANKFDVKNAVETLFNVNVTKVCTTITRGKWKRRGQYRALSPKVKRARVTLRADQKINIFEG